MGHVSQTNATIYSDDGVTTKSNPLTTDASGRFDFFVANGRYDIKVSGTGFTTFTQTDVDIHDETDVTVPGETPLAGNLIFSGNNTHSGTEAFSGAVTETGGLTISTTPYSTSSTGTHSGAETFTGNLTATLGQNSLNVFSLNGVILVDGIKYPCSSTGINAAIATQLAAGGGTVDARICTSITGANYTTEIDIGNVAGTPIVLLVPNQGTWLCNLTDVTGTAMCMKLFHQSAVLGTDPAYGPFQIRPASSSLKVAAFIGNDQTNPNTHIRLDGFEAVLFSGTAIVTQAIGWFTNLADGSVISNMTFANLSSTNATKVFWLNNSCCNVTVSNVVAEAFGLAGVTPCWFGNGAGPGTANLSIRVDSINCLHQGTGASALVVQQWNEFGDNLFKNVYLETTVAADATTPAISIQPFGTPTKADHFIAVNGTDSSGSASRYTFDIGAGSKAVIAASAIGAANTHAVFDHNLNGAGVVTQITNVPVNNVFDYSTERGFFNGQSFFQVGTQAAPSITSIADSATGFSFSTAFGDNAINVSNNGLARSKFTAVGANGGPGFLTTTICDPATGSSCLNFGPSSGTGAITIVGANNAILQGINNTKALTADWTCGTGGTVASCTSATIIGSGGGVPLTFTLPLVVQSYTLECDGVVGQATAVTANQWNLLTATNGATNVTANYSMATAATASAFGAVTDQASTTTTFQIAPSWTLGAIGTKMPFHIWAKVEGAAVGGTVLSVQLLAPTVGDLVTIYRGTACRIF